MPNKNFRHSFKSKKEEMNILSKGAIADTSAKAIKQTQTQL